MSNKMRHDIGRYGRVPTEDDLDKSDDYKQLYLKHLITSTFDKNKESFQKIQKQYSSLYEHPNFSEKENIDLVQDYLSILRRQSEDENNPQIKILFSEHPVHQMNDFQEEVPYGIEDSYKIEKERPAAFRFSVPREQIEHIPTKAEMKEAIRKAEDSYESYASYNGEFGEREPTSYETNGPISPSQIESFLKSGFAVSVDLIFGGKEFSLEDFSEGDYFQGDCRIISTEGEVILDEGAENETTGNCNFTVYLDVAVAFDEEMYKSTRTGAKIYGHAGFATALGTDIMKEFAVQLLSLKDAIEQIEPALEAKISELVQGEDTQQEDVDREAVAL